MSENTGQANNNNNSSMIDSSDFVNLDPSLHSATLESVSNGPVEGELSQHEESRLSDFAQHVLGGDNPHDDAASLLALGEGDNIFGSGHPQPGFSDLMAAAEQSHMNNNNNDNEEEAVDVGLSLNEGDTSKDINGGDVTGETGVDGQDGTQAGTGRGGRKRRREGEGGENDGDVSRMKKDSHKEVERRRRENINDGINEIARHLPGGMEKMGKGTLLRRAAEYLEEVATKAKNLEETLASRDSGKGDLQAELDRVQLQLAEEQARVLRLETSWREAEDRAAQSQFELVTLKGQLEELKKGSTS